MLASFFTIFSRRQQMTADKIESHVKMHSSTVDHTASIAIEEGL